MKKLLNTLYVLTPDSYLFCRNETICVQVGGEEKVSLPALSIDAIVCFGKMTVSTPLLEFCGQRGISVTFLTKTGHFMGRFYGPVSGNVLLRKRQYESLSDTAFCSRFVQTILYAKIRNSRLVLTRAARTCKTEDARTELLAGAGLLGEAAQNLSRCETVDSMRGIEGAAATAYFSRFDCMIQKIL